MEVLDLKTFDILVYCEENQHKSMNIAEIENDLYYSAKDIKQAIEHLKKIGFLTEEKLHLKLTPAAYEYLQPFKVKRAILLAAGLGSRMYPITETLPKPLVRVKGKRLIETLLDALMAKDIMDITIVTGHLAEEFEVIADKYPFVKFINNDRYNEENNISSALKVKDLYGGAYVMDADLYLKNTHLIRKYEYKSNYLGIKVDKTNDWCFEMNGNNIVNMKQGGANTYLTIGISFWTQEAGKQFAKDILKVYEKADGKSKYWDDVVLTQYNENYDIVVRPCKFKDIIEIDSFDELLKMDESYSMYL
ncbi:MAG: phosphocholine cytidylyltransferase family protein [Erysipelotrichaceae bacterium]|nr:phosphocholine cytidylyltransferase family protein [Erysipelotrichaceae bacterium]